MLHATFQFCSVLYQIIMTFFFGLFVSETVFYFKKYIIFFKICNILKQY